MRDNSTAREMIGGARRMGKTNLLHGFVVALLQGGETRLALFDGKGGVEFSRYANQSRSLGKVIKS